MEQYQHIVDSPEPMMTLVLNRKTGKIPKGTYAFAEYYCTDKCDCRRVLIIVLNEKLKQKAVISFGFDQDSPFSGPYLDQSNHQSPYAEDLLKFFVDSLNAGPMWLDRLYRHYREVREKVEGQPYHGKPFPKPGQLVYHVMPPPDLEAEILQSLKNLRGSTPAPPRAGRASAVAPGTEPAPPAKAEEDMAALVARYADLAASGPVEKQLTLQRDLKNYLLAHEDSPVELAKLLPELSRRSPQDDERINAALRLLFDGLNLLEEEMETGRDEAGRRMQTLQESLARQVYEENEDLDLAAAVSNILIQSRVDLLPKLRQATTKLVVLASQRSDLRDTPGEDILSGIARSLDSMGVKSPFEAADEILQLLTLNEPDMQAALIGEMLTADNPLLRELSALMIFHPNAAVRIPIAQLLAGVDGATVTPETLRRLIISRNWLRDLMRKDIDRAITNARKARVQCAPLGRPQSITVYASAMDGGGEQLFVVVVPDGGTFSRCSITVRQVGGVTEVNIGTLRTKGEVSGYVALLKKEGRFVESAPEYLDLRICHALAENINSANAPSQWLIHVAELLGRDRWMGIPFDAGRELLSLWEELDAHNRKLLDPGEYQAALRASGEWQLSGSFLWKWYEADDGVDKEIRRFNGGRKKIDAQATVEYLLTEGQEDLRRRWLERIVVAAMLLKSCHRPPIPWHQMFHVGQAVADDTVPLVEIPLMVNIATATVSAFITDNGGGAKK